MGSNAQQQKVHQHRPVTTDHLRKKQPIERTVLIPASEADQEALDAARQAVGTAELTGRGLDEAKASLKAVEKRVREEGVEFVFRGIGRRRYEDLQREYPPTKEQKEEHGEDALAFNPEAFWPALLAETVVNASLSADQWRTEIIDNDNWGPGEVGLLIETAQAVNRLTRVAQLGN